MGGFIQRNFSENQKLHLLSFFSHHMLTPKQKLTKTGLNTQTTPKKRHPKRNTTQMIGLFLGPLSFLYTFLLFTPEEMSHEAHAVLACTIWIAIWWVTEAIPIPVTSLLPIILFPLTGAVEDQITSSYANNNIFLFLGGFVIAIALQKWNLHRRIAMNIILLVGTSTQKLVLGFMIATGFLSMWISNTATAMMMLPIALSVISHFNETLQEESEQEKFGKMLMLGIAYSASIGGLGTLIGTPPNIIFSEVVRELYDVDISFAKWMQFAVPISIFSMMFAWIYLVKVAFPLKYKQLPGGKTIIKEQKKELGSMSMEEKLVGIVFIATAFAWVSRTFFLEKILPGINDTIIAISATIALFLIPAKGDENKRLLTWHDAKAIPWDILLLFGGGLAIAKGFKDSGLTQWIGEQLTVLQGVSVFGIILAVATLVLFLTEITSNTATATMMFPILASLAAALHIHPYALMIAAGLAASCAFMLPVATPPNAVVFGSGILKMTDMVKVGLWFNLFCILILTLACYYYLPFIWELDLTVFPSNF